MGRNVLYIEDNPDNLMLVKRAIEAIGHSFFGLKMVFQVWMRLPAFLRI